jgi:hypothetical protein
MMVNATHGKGFTLSSYSPRDLLVSETEPWTVSENAWFKSEDKNITFYSDYSIDVAQGRYPTATDKIKEGSDDRTRNPLLFPFIFEVGRSDYLYFYDIAGEDAEESGNRLAMMIKNAPTGIFYLVDGSMNRSALMQSTTIAGVVLLSCAVATVAAAQETYSIVKNIRA